MMVHGSYLKISVTQDFLLEILNQDNILLFIFSMFNKKVLGSVPKT